MGPVGWIVVASIAGAVIYKTSKKRAQKKREKRSLLVGFVTGFLKNCLK